MKNLFISDEKIISLEAQRIDAQKAEQSVIHVHASGKRCADNKHEFYLEGKEVGKEEFEDAIGRKLPE